MELRAVLLLGSLLWAQVALSRCVGDCDLGGRVAIDEIGFGLVAALRGEAASTCAGMDVDDDEQVTIDELVSAVTSAVDGCSIATPSPTATLRPTPGSESEPGLPDPRPSVAAECGGGYGVAAFREASADANSIVGFGSPVDLTKTEGALAFVTPILVTFGGSAVTCPTRLDQAVRLFTFTIGGVTSAPRAGSVYALKPGYDLSGPPNPTVAQLDYLERLPLDAGAGRGWRAQSGTLTVEAYDGTAMRVRVRAEMKAEPSLYPIASVKPVGTVRLDMVLAIDDVAQR